MINKIELSQKSFLASLGYDVVFADKIPQEFVHFESSMVIIGGLTSESIVADYDLYVLGNVQVKRIHVKRNIYVFGNISSDSITVNGTIQVTGDLKCKSVEAGGDILAFSIDTEKCLVGKDLLIKGPIIVGEYLKVKDSLISLEGILGPGSCTAETVISKDYIQHVEINAQRSMVLNSQDKETPDALTKREYSIGIFSDHTEMEQLQVELSKENFILLKLFEDYVKTMEQHWDYDEIGVQFDAIQRFLPNYSLYCENYLKILKLSHLSKLEYIEEFIVLLNIKASTPKFMYSISLVEDVLGEFFVEAKQNTRNLRVRNNDRESVIQSLYFLQLRKYLLDAEQYDNLVGKLLNTLFSGC